MRTTTSTFKEEPQNKRHLGFSDSVVDYLTEHQFQPDDTLENCLSFSAHTQKNVPLEELNLSIRAHNCLIRRGISTVGELLELTLSQLVLTRNLGSRCFVETIEMLIEHRQKQSDAIKVVSKMVLSPNEKDELYPYRGLMLDGRWDEIKATNMSLEATERLKQLQTAYQTLGSDILRDFFHAPTMVIHTLDEIATRAAEIVQIRIAVNKCLEDIPEERMKLPVANFAYAKTFPYTANFERLMQCFATDDSCIGDIREHYHQIDISQLPLLTSFLKWCSFDLQSELLEIAQTLFRSEREKEIMTLRSQNHTLNEVGEICNLTRERVRQIEKRICDHFLSLEEKYHIHLKIFALQGENIVLSEEDVRRQLKCEPECFLFLLRSISEEKYIYSKSLKVFVRASEELLHQVETFVNDLPETFKLEEIDQFLSEAEKCSLPPELVERQIELDYSRTSTLYYKGHFSLTEMYRQTMIDFYPNGLHVYDNESLCEFRKHVRQKYGQEIKLPENDRAISARLAEIGVLCGRGIYRPKASTYIPDSLAQKLYDYIVEMDTPIILTNILFAKFEVELIEAGVDNKYYLQGILNELYRDEFIFTRDYISKDKNITSIYSTIVNYIKQFDHPISKSQICTQFPGVSDIVLAFATSDPSIINYFGEYMHIERLAIDEAEKNILKGKLDELVADGATHTSRELFAYMNTAAPDVLEKMDVPFHFALFSICERLFSEEYEFDRPYFARRGVTLSQHK